MKPILKDIVRSSSITVGMFQQILHPEITAALAGTGLNYVIADLEHSGYEMRDVIPLLPMAAVHGLPMLVRVREKDQSLIEQVLDAGGQGILVPTVETVDECEMIVRASRFAPAGERGWGNMAPAKRWMPSWQGDEDGEDFGLSTYARFANRDVFVAILIETPKALANLPDMVKVCGLDAFVLGPGDLSVRMGKSGRDPAVKAALLEATATITAADRIACPIGPIEDIADYRASGAQMYLLATSERVMIRSALRNMTADISA